MKHTFQNWSGAVKFAPDHIVYPKTALEIEAFIQQALAQNEHIRLVGSGHSFSPLIATNDLLLSLDRFQGLETIDIENMEVTIKAGTKLHLMNQLLAGYGLAIENMGDVDRQSVAGALCTGTHGTGLDFGILATQIRGIRFIDGQGNTHNWREDHPEFKGAVVSLGALGVITHLTLGVLPAYRLSFEQTKESVEQCLAHLEDHIYENRHYEFYYFPHTEVVQSKAVNVNSGDPTPTWKHLLNDLLLENLAFQGICEVSKRIPQSTVPIAKLCGAMISDSLKINDSHKVFAVPRWVRFNEMEYNIPREHFTEVFLKLKQMIERDNIRVHFPIECRFVQEDDIWISPAYQRESAYIAIHQYKGMPYEDYFKKAEALFREYGGRPHWGKMHFQTANTLKELYPKWEDFQSLRQSCDPQGIFATPYMHSLWDA